MRKAFVLGAGLGTRLRPLTDQLPKPLIPVFGRPLIEFAFEHLARAGVGKFVVNTHHRADEYRCAFPHSAYAGLPITFRHEPILLETGGGIDNVADLLAPDPFLVYNGDILTDLPLAPLLEAHDHSNHLVTLVLRSQGAAAHVALDPAGGNITDIRGLCGTDDPGAYQFTGIYACRPEFLGHLRHGEKHSVIPIFLELIKAGQLGGVVIDDGNWWDLGTRDAYLDAHKAIAGSPFPAYLGDLAENWQQTGAQQSSVAGNAKIDKSSYVGQNARVGACAVIENSILWSGAEVAAGAPLQRCIVRSGETARGDLDGVDL